MGGRLDKYERMALDFLAARGGGFTAGTIARNCGHGSSRSLMAVFRTMTLRDLFERGLIDKIDAKKPAVFVITDAGRQAITAEGGGNG